MLFGEYEWGSPYKNFIKSSWIASRWYINQVYCRKCKEIYTSQVNQILNRCFLSASSENWEGASKIFPLSITHIFCYILCDNSVLLHKEGWKLVSMLGSLAENIMQIGKAIKFRPQRFYSKE